MREFLIATMLGSASACATAPEAREWKATDGMVVKYRWSEPEKIEPGKSYPLVLFLHGAGERGDDNKAQLKHGVIPIIKGAQKLGTPVFLIAPQCPAGQWWTDPAQDRTRLSAADQSNTLMENVLALVADIQKKHPVDPKRLHVTGISMGGFGTWDLLARAPGRIASAIPICGGGHPELADKFKDVPIWAFHGEADEVVPVTATRNMIVALEKAGGKPKVTYYPKVGHDSWTRTYDNPEVIRWMLEQIRP
jgi:predicted peptidase